MTARILCPIDGTDHATTGLVQAIDLAKLNKGHLTICIVNVAEGGARGGPTIAHWSDADAAKILSAAATTARDAGLTDVDTAELISRETAAAIVTYAAQQDFSLIVMGTGDKRGVKRLVLGSVAAEVAGHADCSVLVAR
ncbi:MAG: universal stress protein [Proteobacteria bacterium]|nr:universal stress protein [Pseudomonadota bacterium]